ncbi:MAG: septal ring lytic transglycosylase RlpA family protein [Alphaproteobacteria bacterium]|nr:septal ring lytic transglycosylase RlpA family protein [Alphaproteobacteria bacterium]
MAAIVPATAHPAVRHHEHTADVQNPQAYFIQSGSASYYGEKHGGKITASGTSFDWRDFTAAHPWLPFGTIVRVTNLRNRRWVKVRVTDRGPHTKSRVIDVSAAAARELGMFRRGVARGSVKAFHEDQDSPLAEGAPGDDAKPDGHP